MTANRPEQPLQTQQLRKRYRQVRRRQLAGILLITGLAVAVLVLLLLALFFLRACARQGEGALRSRLTAERGEGSLPQVVFAKTFAGAPWLIGASDTALFCAGDSQQREAGYSSNYPVDNIAAYPFAEAEGTLWESAAQSEFMGLAVAQQSIVLYSHYLTETTQVSLTALDQLNGHQVWTHTINEAQSPSFAVSGKVFIVAYWLPDGYRLVGYNAATGVKAWGYKLGMVDEIDLSAGAPQLRLLASADRVCYCLGTGIGFIDSGNGKLLRRQSLPADVSQLAIDWDNGSCLITSEPDEEGECVLYRMPLSAGIPVELHRFVPDRGLPQLVHYAGKALLAYSGREAGAEHDGCHILCFDKSASTPLQHTVLAPGVPVAAAAFPAGASGALVSVCSELAADGMTPRGKGSLFRVSPETGGATLHSRLARPVVALLPFKQDIVMLHAGGGLRVFAAEVNQHLHLADLGEPQSSWSFSPSGDTLLITSFPQAHAAGSPGGRLQATVVR